MTLSMLYSSLRSMLLAGVCLTTLAAAADSPGTPPETTPLPEAPTLPPLADVPLPGGQAASPDRADSSETPALDPSAPQALPVPESAQASTNTPSPATREAAEAAVPAPGEAPAAENGSTERPSGDDRRTNGRGRENSRSFDRFQLIVDRNIFDSERRKQVANRQPEPRIEQPRTQTISLNGTISYGGKAFAFVSSSESEYRGVFSPGDTLGGWRLESVDTRGVKLKAEDGELDLPVGKSLRRDGEEAWRVSEELVAGVTSGRFGSSSTPRGPGGGSGSRRSGGAPPTPGGSPMAGTPAPAAPPAAAGGGDMSDIIKRMMERRKQEQSQ